MTSLWSRILPSSLLLAIDGFRRMKKKQVCCYSKNNRSYKINRCYFNFWTWQLWALLFLWDGNCYPYIVIILHQWWQCWGRSTRSWIIMTLTQKCSESMSPAFERGDVLYVARNVSKPLKAGDVVVFKIKGRDIPIVHRIIKLHEE